jgi:WD40 repeat protein
MRSNPSRSLRISLLHEPVKRWETIYSWSFDNTIRVWNLESGECVQTLAGPPGSLMHEPVKRWENHLFRII